MFTGTKEEVIVFLVGQVGETVYDLTEHKEKRRLTQNAYYWTLLGKAAQKLRMSRSEVHNRMLMEHGQIWLDDDGSAVFVYKPDTAEARETMLRSNVLHWGETSKTRTAKNGQEYRRWVLLLPSHLMTVEEFSALTDGMVQEAKQLGIETLTPRELEEIRTYELQKQKGKSNGHTDESQAGGC